jgi:predicted RND superfamily exporter protein
MYAFIEFCRRQTLWVLLILIGLTALAGWKASGLVLDSNLTRLLPESAPSVRGLDELEETYGGQIGRLTVVLDGAGRETLEGLADGLEDDLAGLEGVRRVEVKKPVDFFRKFRLLYASYDDLEEARKRLQKRIKWEKKQANPLFVSLGDDDPPEVDFSDLTAGYGDLEQSPYYVGQNEEDETSQMLALFVYPSFASTNLERTRALSGSVRALLDDRLDEQLSDHPEVSYGLTGRYQKRVDLQNVLQSDLGLATTVALSLLALFLLLFLRSPSGMLVVGLPLITGTVWAMAWAQTAFGSLNILTGFLGAVLLGIGVDYGIHLYVRYHQLREQMPAADALVETFATSGRANFYGGLTTAVALASLIVTDFRAFYEFGVISLGGIALILLAFALMMPPLVFLFERGGRRFNAPASLLLTRRLDGWLSNNARQVLPQASRAAAIALGVLVIVASVGLFQLEFERSFAPLENRSSSSWKLDQKINELLGQSQTPTVVLTDSPEHSQKVITELERRRDNEPGGDSIDKVVALSSLLPPTKEGKTQSDKLELLEKVLADLKDVPSRARSDKLGAYIDEIAVLLEEGPITQEMLPISVREPFQTKSDDLRVVLVFPAIDLAEIDQVARFVSVLEDLPDVDAPGRYDAISEALLLYDIVRLVERDAVWMLGLTLSGLLLISIAAFRRRREVLLQMGILAACFVGALGLAGWMGISLNFLNIIIMPIWLGLGIDASFHVLMHLHEHPDDLSAQVTTAAAVAGAFLTSMVGFGAMLLAHHQGLFSLGAIAVLGLGTVLAVNLLAHLILVGNAKPGGPSA